MLVARYFEDLTFNFVLISLAKDLYFIQNAEGAGLAPFDCWTCLRGIKTMALRVEKQQVPFKPFLLVCKMIVLASTSDLVVSLLFVFLLCTKYIFLFVGQWRIQDIC